MTLDLTEVNKMSRYYNNKAIELLAPAGTFDIFEGIIQANCDAVYFGGQVLNMRMIRKGYNFSNDDIKKSYPHST